MREATIQDLHELGLNPFATEDGFALLWAPAGEVKGFRESLKLLLSAERERALEDAARAAETVMPNSVPSTCNCPPCAGMEAAQRIRALKGGKA